MYRKFAIAAALVLATSVPALAGECGGAPIPPDLSGLNGATASIQQMKDAIGDFKSFQSATDQYQACLIANLKAKKLAAANAKHPKPVDPSIIAGTNSEITARQSTKAQLGQQLNAQIIAYKKAHPKG
jgi:hypothetical protein